MSKPAADKPAASSGKPSEVSAADAKSDASKPTDAEAPHAAADGNAPLFTPGEASDGKAADTATDTATDAGLGETKADDGKATDAKPGDTKAGDSKATDAKPAGTAAGEGTLADGKAPEAKPSEAGDAKAAERTAADGQATDTKVAGAKAGDTKAGDTKVAEAKAGGAKAADGNGDAKGREHKAREQRRSLVTTLLSVFVVLIVVIAFGYFGGLGPLGKLSQRRALNPPELLGGLARITDQETRSRLQLDQSAATLSKNNKGETSVEAYGDVASSTGLFVVIALRGKIDVNQTVADSGATADQVKQVGKDTCTTQTDDIVTCYRTSNTLTVMVRNSTGQVGVDRVAPITDEAFNAYN